jgi:hypothetical protein
MMMRLGRWASLLVAFSLLASVATASAECAWVLWYRVAALYTTISSASAPVFGDLLPLAI